MSSKWMNDAESFSTHDARGANPVEFFPLITGLGDGLPEGEGLHVIQSFEPVPLYAVMTAKGLEHSTDQVADDEFHVYFYRPLATTESADVSMSAKMEAHLTVEPGRIGALQSIFEAFYDGAAPAELQAEFDRTIGSIDGAEFAYIEQKMTEVGIGDDEFKERVDELIGVFRRSLDSQDGTTHPDGHPLHTLARENEALTELADDIRGALSSSDSQDLDVSWWNDALERLWQVDIHYARKENQLFPRLEEKGFDKPSTVMWRIHDEIRDGIKGLRQALDAGQYAELLAQAPAVLDQLVDMTFKEEKILIPTSIAMLSEDEFAEVRRGEEEIGYCLIDAPPTWPQNLEPWPNPDAAIGTADTAPEGSAHAQPFENPDRPKSCVGAIALRGGMLAPGQISMLLEQLPVDFAFIDEYDEVCYASGVVNEIDRSAIEMFKAGTRDTVVNWAEGANEGFYTRIVALRDDDGRYQGALATRHAMPG